MCWNLHASHLTLCRVTHFLSPKFIIFPSVHFHSQGITLPWTSWNSTTNDVRSIWDFISKRSPKYWWVQHRQKNLILEKFMKRLGLPTTPHPKLYTIGWLLQGRDLYVNKKFHLPYNFKPFTDDVLCDVSPLEFCDVLLGQPYLWKLHVVYESSLVLSLFICVISYIRHWR